MVLARSPGICSHYTAFNESVQAHDALVTRFSRVELLCLGPKQRDLGAERALIMSNRRRGYVAYLLRLWQATEGENASWRASLECPQTGERWGFACLAQMFAFLQERTDMTSPATGVEKGERTPKTSSKSEED